jgi:hypothetical protein
MLPTIPLKWLISDLIHLSSRNNNCLSLYIKKNSKRPLLLQTITGALRNKRLGWLPTVQSKINSPLLAITPDLLPASWGPSLVSYVTIWLPKFSSWTVRSSRQKKVPVSLVPLGLLTPLMKICPSFTTIASSSTCSYSFVSSLPLCCLLEKNMISKYIW